VALSVHYAMDRSWYMRELHKAHTVEEGQIRERG